MIGYPRGAGVAYERFVSGDRRGRGLHRQHGRARLGRGAPAAAMHGARQPRPGGPGGGRRRAARRAARAILDALGHGPFVFNLGEGVVPQTPPEHVAALADIVRAWPDGNAQ